MKPFDTIIIGGGAAGMSTAIVLSSQGKRVLLLEKNDRLGKKILISGNGRCNITNRHITPSRYHSTNPAFVAKALEGYDFAVVAQFLSTIGLVLEEEEEGKMFPASRSAKSVVSLFEASLRKHGAHIALSQTVHKVAKHPKGFEVATQNHRYYAKEVVLSAGSPAYPKLGGDFSALKIAQALNHRIITPYPSLVQLCTRERFVKKLSGLKLKARLNLFDGNKTVAQTYGDLLFTDYGLSGLAVLDISRHTSYLIAGGKTPKLVCDLMPRFSKERLAHTLQTLASLHAEGSVFLQGLLHPKLASHFAKTLSASPTKKELRRLAHALKGQSFHITDTKGFAFAEVAAGGVDTTQIDPYTMQSKLIKGFFVIGEALDVDGDRGGFNFHWAFTSALRCAKGVLKHG